MKKRITISSGKAKGRRLQQWVRDKLIEHFVTLGKQGDADDFASTTMGESGADIRLSPRGKELCPFSIECKSKKAHSVYRYYEQAQGHYPNLQPLVFIKQDRSRPLVIMDAEYFINNIRLY